jgi:uncharacterized protein YqgC (DUF456 family)
MEQALLFAFQVLCFAIIVGAWLTLPLMIIPGATIIWGISVLYIVVTGFNKASIAILVFQTVLMLITNTLDNFLMGGSAKAQGASWWSLGAALVGAIIGAAIFPPLGGIPGGFLALFIAELIQKGDPGHAWKSVKAMMTGFGWSSITRFVAGSMMVFWFGAYIFIQLRGWV